MHWPDIVVCGQCSCVCGGGVRGDQRRYAFLSLVAAESFVASGSCVLYRVVVSVCSWLHTTELQAFDLRLRRAPLLLCVSGLVSGQLLISELL